MLDRRVSFAFRLTCLDPGTFVLQVQRFDGTHADWIFQGPATVTGTPNQMKVNGNSPAAPGVQVNANTIRLLYSGVNSGFAWTINASEPNMSPTPVFPQSGLVI